MSGVPDGVRIAWAAVPPGAERRAVAWSLVRALLGAEGAHARISNPCPLCAGLHGPVRIDDAPFLAGVTYADDLAVAGVVAADGAASFAIDAEREDAEVPVDILGAGRTIRDWVRIEASLKADRRGLRVDPSTVEVDERDEEWLARVPGRLARVHGRDVPGPPGILISVAVCASPEAPEAQDDPATTRAAP